MIYEALLIVAEPKQDDCQATIIDTLKTEATSEDHARRIFAVQADSMQRARRRRGLGHKGQMVRFVWMGPASN